MTKKELLARIELLEARVSELEARPAYYPYWPVIPPNPTYPTFLPDPFTYSAGTGEPLPPLPRITCETSEGW